MGKLEGWGRDIEFAEHEAAAPQEKMLGTMVGVLNLLEGREVE